MCKPSGFAAKKNSFQKLWLKGSLINEQNGNEFITINLYLTPHEKLADSRSH